MAAHDAPEYAQLVTQQLSCESTSLTFIHASSGLYFRKALVTSLISLSLRLEFAMDSKDISRYAQAAEQFINDLAKAFRERRWVTILSVLGVVVFVFLNPLTIEYPLGLFGFKKPKWFFYLIWGIATAPFFIAAFLVALLTKKQRQPEAKTTATSIIKGLLPYTKEDGEWFAMLQRGSILRDCLRFCGEETFRFAILSGESGVGKTSFLQAGLFPNLEQKGHRAVYVKFTDSSPLDSIRLSLNESVKKPILDANQSLLGLLRQATRDDARSIVLILDQFEQFFAHNKSNTSRKSFIQQMTDWHKEGVSLPVKILISIRGDFTDRLTEFQKEMEYTLTPHNNLRLEKFEPQEAANVIAVIAKEAEIEFDEGFVDELTKYYLADQEDGTVSPVDIQILSWMIDGQKSSAERAFNRKAFQKLGGVEGLLERFLIRALGARQTDAARQAALKVMLTLTDKNVRAGALSLNILKGKLNGIIPDGDIQEAVAWLARGDVRLIIPIQEQDVTLYELAHDRVITPLRRLAFQEITDIEKAQQTLDRRVNEWIGNNRASRYLLTLKEWRLIKNNWTLITLASQKEQKEELLFLSKRRFVVTGLSFAVILLLAFSGYAGYRWYERRPETQTYYAEKRLVDLLNGNKDFRATKYTMFLLSVLENDSDQELSQNLRRQISGIDPAFQADMLSSLAEAYIELSKEDEALEVLDKVQLAVEKLDPSDRARLLSSLAATYGRLSKVNEAAKGLLKVQLAVETLGHSDQARVLSSLAAAYGRLSKADGAANGLDKVRLAVEKLPPDDQVYALTLLAEPYGNLSKVDEAANGLNKIRQAVEKFGSSDQALMLPSVAAAYIRLSKADEAVKILDTVEQTVEKLDSSDQARVLPSLITVYGQLSEADNAATGLDKIQQAVEKLDSYLQAGVLVFLAEAYGNLPNADAAAKGLDKVQLATEKLDSSDQVPVLLSLARAYGRLLKADYAVKGLDRIQRAGEKLDPAEQAYVLSWLTKAYGKLSNANETASGLDKIQQTVEKLDPSDQVSVLPSLAVAYAKLPEAEEATKKLDKIQLVVEKLDPSDQVRVLPSLTEAYGNLSNAAEVTKALHKIEQAVERIPDADEVAHRLPSFGIQTLNPSDRARVLLSLANAYGKLSKADDATKGLNRVHQAVEKLSANDQVYVLPSLAEEYGKLSKVDEAAKILAQVQQAANGTSSEIKSSVLVIVATICAKLNLWREAVEATQSIGNEVYAMSALSRILIIWRDKKNGTQNMDTLEGLFDGGLYMKDPESQPEPPNSDQKGIQRLKRYL